MAKSPVPLNKFSIHGQKSFVKEKILIKKVAKPWEV
jgi:hypothetical protein